VLAYEINDPYEYCVLHSYGYAESMKADEIWELVGTSYYNYTCPLIRYRTGDEIGAIQQEGDMLTSFQVTTGREGDFVLDGKGKKIPLTGLIFGRHHELFNFCSHLQVSQAERGKVIVHYCPIPGREREIVPHAMFDSSGVSLEFVFVAIAEPIKTKAGKVRLLVDPTNF
jgi:phenylacetate-CoA ligase